VPAGDAKALAQAMQAALSLDENGRAALASRGKSHIGKHFSLARMTEGTLKVYDDLLGSDLAGRGGADTAKG
jgi:glycosyltransferase involved in cell wall biosynthesis